MKKLHLSLLLSPTIVSLANADGGDDWQNVNFTGANLTGANFEGSSLYGSDFESANLESASFFAIPKLLGV